MTLEEYLEHGPYSWPGGYPVYAINKNMEYLCFNCSKTMDKDDFIMAEIYWEGLSLICPECNNTIPSAYGCVEE